MKRNPTVLDRGATLVEYALGMSLVVVACIGVVQGLEDRTADKVGDRAASIGDPVEGAGTTTTTVGTSTTLEDPEEPPEPVEASATGSGVAFSQGTGNKWRAEVTYQVVDANGEPVSGVTISGTWDPPPSGSDSQSTVECIVQAGTCTLHRWDLPNGASTATFTPTAVDGDGYIIDVPAGVSVSQPPD